MTLFITYLFTIIFFLALTFSLGYQPGFLTRLNGYILFIAGTAGILLYGYGYSVVCSSTLQAMIRTLFSVFCMFLGRNEISAISQAPGLQSPFMQLLIYATHLLALYCTASTVIATLGTRLIRTVRLFLLRRNNLNLIFGANDDSINFASQLQREHRGHVIFADSGAGSSYDRKIIGMGSILFTDADAAKPTPAFLKRIGMTPGNRQLHVFCLDCDEAANLSYARSLSEILKSGGFGPKEACLSAIFTEETSGEALLASQSGGEESGAFGSVIAVERPDMLARLMIHDCPPYEMMSFDKNALAADNFECLIIGFGQTGQAALRQIIANGQFAGSAFHATIVAKDYYMRAGSFFYRFPGLRAHDEWFTVIEDNARSVKFYDYLEANRQDLNYIAICTGNDKENAEIAYELRDYLSAHGNHPAIMLISDNGVSRLTGTGLRFTQALFTTDILCTAKLDAMAMVINHQYHLAEGRTAAEDWESCDYFSRLSCRASADFMDAFLKAAGTSREAVLAGGWDISDEILENLACTEHLRWCAFHETMGYQVMPEEVFAERALQYAFEKERYGAGKIRIGKDTASRLHACLIPWEELDALSARENAVTGKSVDYKEMDRDNVRMIPEMLKGEQN